MPAIRPHGDGRIAQDLAFGRAARARGSTDARLRAPGGMARDPGYGVLLIVEFDRKA